MIKKTIYLLLLLISFGLQAQNAVGDWNIYGVFGNNVINVIDANSKVYSLVDGWLYCYDKENQETYSVSESGDLNDVEISDIYYDYNRKNLFVVYKNSNIDIIFDNGEVVNMPEIYNASITGSKTINDVIFSNKGTYITTDFGYVLINDAKLEVKESRIYNTPISSVCVMGDKLLVSTKNSVYIEEIGKHYSNISELKETSFKQGGKLLAINDNELFIKTGWLFVYKMNGNDIAYKSTISTEGAKSFQRTAQGYQYVTTQGVGQLVTLDANANKTASITLPDHMKSSFLSSYEVDGSLWELSPKGLRHVSLSDAGAETVFMDYALPNTSTVDIPYYLTFNEALGKLFVMNCGSNRYYNNYNRVAALSSFDGTTWKNEIPSSVATINPHGQKNNRINSPYDLVFDPEDPNTCYIGTWFEGVYKITNGEVVDKYDWTNSPIDKVEIDATFHTCTTPAIKFDKSGNLWVLQSFNNTTQFAVLPREKKNQSTLTREDWLTPQVEGVEGDFRSHLFITSRDVKLHGIGNYGDPLTIFYDDGNPASSNIKSKVFSSLTDQDGKEYSWSYINCFAEDKKGRVWMGTNNGVVEFYPHNAFKTGEFTINHLKVPRNDGTNLADYLLDNTDVTCIAIDGSNRKWIGTSSSGVLLVSEDGSEILEQFTTDNSPMLSNKVLSVCCNSTNNKVYIGTDKGLMEYSSDSEPPAIDYSNIYAYPNPVRPEYTGDITIRGLMENSLVKIADSAGNVVKSVRSSGGMATWDGCNYQGEPVKSGVYFILASQNENESSSGAVSKILIIR